MREVWGGGQITSNGPKNICGFFHISFVHRKKKSENLEQTKFLPKCGNMDLTHTMFLQVLYLKNRQSRNTIGFAPSRQSSKNDSVFKNYINLFSAWIQNVLRR